MRRSRRINEATTTERVADLHFTSARVTHSQMPPNEPDGYTTTSEPFSIGVSFTGHVKAVVAYGSSRSRQLSFAPGIFGITGAEAVQWLRVSEPSEAVMIYPGIDEIAREPHVIHKAWTQYADFQLDRFDPVIWGICARLRMAALGAAELSNLEVEELIDFLLVHIAVRHLGAQRPRRIKGKLDARRLRRVADLIDSRLNDPPTLHEMAAAAAMSRYHFQRLFRATIGLTPREYVAARRMENARRMLTNSELTVAQISESLGFSDPAHFRRSFHRQFNASPRGAIGASPCRERPRALARG
jgi:AraC-like DNA-binding protein